jgi:hypothetical protein
VERSDVYEIATCSGVHESVPPFAPWGLRGQPSNATNENKGGNEVNDNKKVRTRRWVFTLNNPEVSKEELLEMIKERAATRYVVIGEEVAPTTGTIHYQGFVEYENAATFEQLKARLPLAHIERAKGSNQQNKAYCTKDNNFVEDGKVVQRTQQGEAAISVLTLLQEGSTLIDIATQYQELATYCVKNWRNLKDIETELKVSALRDKRKEQS